MESVQREVVSVLLGRIRTLGLISSYTYSGAVDLVYSVMDFPDFFQYPVRLTEEAGGDEHTTGAP